MRLAIGAPQTYFRSAALYDCESIQAVAVNASSEVLAAISQLQLHFWGVKLHVVHLTSIPVPQCSLEGDTAEHVLWHPLRRNDLVVATARRVIFFEADIVFPSCGLLAPINGTSALQFCDAASRVCSTTQVSIDSGLTFSLTSGGSSSFLVHTTSGMVYVIGWRHCGVLHAWNACNLLNRQCKMARGHDEIAVVDLPVSSTQACKEALDGPRHSQSFSGDEEPFVRQVLRNWEEMVPTGAFDLSRDMIGSARKDAMSGNCSVGDRARASGTQPRNLPSDSLLNDSTHGISDVPPELMNALSGTIAHVDCAPRLQLLSFVLSSGYVLLAKSSCVTDFNLSEVTLNGRIIQVVSASMARMNNTHSLIAIATHLGELTCRAVNVDTLSFASVPLWSGVPGEEEKGMKLEPVSQMQWNPTSEDMLCLSLGRARVVVLHYSGVCLMSFLSSYEESFVTIPRRFGAGGTHSAELPECVSFAWDYHSTRLFTVEGQGTGFTVIKLARTLCSAAAGSLPGAHTPVALLDDCCVHLLNLSEADVSQGTAEVVQPPIDYVTQNYPLLFGAISANGVNVVCAGLRGCVLFDRDRGKWRIFHDRQHEQAISLVTNPVWMNDVAVALPVRLIDKKTYEVEMYSRRALSRSLMLLRIPLEERRPLQLSSVSRNRSGDGFLVLLDVLHTVSVYRYEFFINPASNDRPLEMSLAHIRELKLTGLLERPLSLLPVCLDGVREVDCLSDMPQLLLHRRSDRAVVCFDLPSRKHDTTKPKVQLEVVDSLAVKVICDVGASRAAGTYQFWLDCSSPLDGLTLLSFEEEGIFLYHAADIFNRGAEGKGRVHRMRVSARERDILPLGPAPFDGFFLCGSVVRKSGMSSVVGATLPGVQHSATRFDVTMRPVLYAHHILERFLWRGASSPTDGEADSDESQEWKTGSLGATSSTAGALVLGKPLFSWLEGMRENGTFLPAMDYFLHTVINAACSASVRQVNCHDIVGQAMVLLRNFPEYHDIIVRCMRKMDTSGWHLLFNVIGSPVDFFVECIDHSCLAEAVHVVRMMMMDSLNSVDLRIPSLNQNVADASGEVTATVTDLGASTASTVPQPTVIPTNSLTRAGTCAIRLFGLTVRSGCYDSAYDLLRFTALWQHEMALQPAVEVKHSENNSLANIWLHGVRGREVPTSETGTTSIFGEASDNLAATFPALRFANEVYPLMDSGHPSVEAEGLTDAEVAQRRASTAHMFAMYAGLPLAVDEEATQLLMSGYVIHLCRLLRTFSLSPKHFVTTKLCGLAVDSLPLTLIVDGLCNEFGLPRSAYVIHDETYSCLHMLAQGAAHSVVGQLFSKTEPFMWTQTQCTLYGIPELLSTVDSLRHLFSIHVCYSAAFNLLLMLKEDLTRILSPAGGSAVSGTYTCAEVTQCAMLREAVTQFADVNRGYGAFIADVYVSLPPLPLTPVNPDNPVIKAA